MIIMKEIVVLMTPSDVKTMSISTIGTKAYCSGAFMAAKITAIRKKAATITRRPAITVDPPQSACAITSMIPSILKSTAIVLT